MSLSSFCHPWAPEHINLWPTRPNGASEARWEALTQVYCRDNPAKKRYQNNSETPPWEDYKPKNPCEAQETTHMGKGNVSRVSTQWHYSLHRTKMASKAAPALIRTSGSPKLSLVCSPWVQSGPSAAILLPSMCSSFSAQHLLLCCYRHSDGINVMTE